MFTRIARDEILENGTREAIVGYVEANPGAHLRGLERELGLQHGTLLHHLRVLESQRYLRSARDGMYRRFYTQGQGAEPVPEDLGRRVLLFVQQHPGTTNTEVAGAVGRRPSLVYYHLQRLAGEGLLRKERAGHVVRLFAEPSAEGGTASLI